MGSTIKWIQPLLIIFYFFLNFIVFFSFWKEKYWDDTKKKES